MSMSLYICMWLYDSMIICIYGYMCIWLYVYVYMIICMYILLLDCMNDDKIIWYVWLYDYMYDHIFYMCNTLCQEGKKNRENENEASKQTT